MDEKKKSWREIDKLRDRSRHRGRQRRDERGALEKALQDKRMKDRYLKEAERLFQGPKGRPEHAKDLRAIHDSYGTPRFGRAVRHYVETYGLPDEWGTLLLLLDLTDQPRIVCQAIEALGRMAPNKGTVERKGLLGKLRVLALTACDPEIQENAQAELAGLQ